MTTDLLASALIFSSIGVFVAIFWVYVLRRYFLGGFWGALVVAVIGAFLGAVLEVALADVISTLQDVGGVNVFPALASAVILTSLFASTSARGSGKEDF